MRMSQPEAVELGHLALTRETPEVRRGIGFESGSKDAR
jgi:hypothetical protein